MRWFIRSNTVTDSSQTQRNNYYSRAGTNSSGSNNYFDYYFKYHNGNDHNTTRFNLDLNQTHHHLHDHDHRYNYCPSNPKIVKYFNSNNTSQNWICFTHTDGYFNHYNYIRTIDWSQKRFIGDDFSTDRNNRYPISGILHFS
jgi:hypothetical protein